MSLISKNVPTNLMKQADDEVVVFSREAQLNNDEEVLVFSSQQSMRALQEKQRTPKQVHLKPTHHENVKSLFANFQGESTGFVPKEGMLVAPDSRTKTNLLMKGKAADSQGTSGQSVQPRPLPPQRLSQSGRASTQASQLSGTTHLFGFSSGANQALQKLLGHLSPADQHTFMLQLGQSVIANASNMSPESLREHVFRQGGPQLCEAYGRCVVSRFNRPMIEQIGSKSLSHFSTRPDTFWGRQCLSQIAQQHFQNFDPRCLAAMPNRSLRPFSSEIMNQIRRMSPLQLGQAVLANMSPAMYEHIGQHAFKSLPPDYRRMKFYTQADFERGPLGISEELLRELGAEHQAYAQMQRLGVQGLSTVPGGLRGLASGVLGPLGKGFLTHSGDSFGLLNLNGRYTFAKALGIGLSFIPGVGFVYNFAQKLPIVGGLIRGTMNVLGGVWMGVQNIIQKIPVVGPLLQGARKILGGVVGTFRKGVSKVVDGVKNVGKKVLGGIKKVFSKI